MKHPTTRVAFALLAALLLATGIACQSMNRYANYEFTSPIEAHDKVCGDCHELYAPGYFSMGDWRTFLAEHPKAHRPRPEVMDAIVEYILQDAPAGRDQAEASL